MSRGWCCWWLSVLLLVVAFSNAAQLTDVYMTQDVFVGGCSVSCLAPAFSTKACSCPSGSTASAFRHFVYAGCLSPASTYGGMLNLCIDSSVTAALYGGSYQQMFSSAGTWSCTTTNSVTSACSCGSGFVATLLRGLSECGSVTPPSGQSYCQTQVGICLQNVPGSLNGGVFQRNASQCLAGNSVRGGACTCPSRFTKHFVNATPTFVAPGGGISTASSTIHMCLQPSTHSPSFSQTNSAPYSSSTSESYWQSVSKSLSQSVSVSATMSVSLSTSLSFTAQLSSFSSSATAGDSSSSRSVSTSISAGTPSTSASSQRSWSRRSASGSFTGTAPLSETLSPPRTRTRSLIPSPSHSDSNGASGTVRSLSDSRRSPSITSSRSPSLTPTEAPLPTPSTASRSPVTTTATSSLSLSQVHSRSKTLSRTNSAVPAQLVAQTVSVAVSSLMISSSGSNSSAVTTFATLLVVGTKIVDPLAFPSLVDQNFFSAVCVVITDAYYQLLFPSPGNDTKIPIALSIVRERYVTSVSRVNASAVLVGISLSPAWMDPALLSSGGTLTFAVELSQRCVSPAALQSLSCLVSFVIQPPPPTPAPPRQVATTVTTAKTVSGLGSIAGGDPVVAAQANRAALSLELVVCNLNSGSLGFVNSPLSLSFGDSDANYSVGAVVGNVVLVLMAVALQLCFVVGFWCVKTRNSRQDAQMSPSTLESEFFEDAAHWNNNNNNKKNIDDVPAASHSSSSSSAASSTWTEAMSFARFPSLLAFVIMFLQQPTMTASVVTLLHAETEYVALGYVGAIVSFVPLLFTAYIIGSSNFFGCTFQEVDPERLSASSLERFFFGVGRWHDVDEGEGGGPPPSATTPPKRWFKQRFQFFFCDYNSRCRTFLCVEMSMNLICGLLQGLIEPGRCESLLAAAVAFFALLVILGIAIRPYGSIYQGIFSISMAILQLLNSVFCGLAVWYSNSSMLDAADTCSQVCLYAIFSQVVVGLWPKFSRLKKFVNRLRRIVEKTVPTLAPLLPDLDESRASVLLMRESVLEEEEEELVRWEPKTTAVISSVGGDDDAAAAVRMSDIMIDDDDEVFGTHSCSSSTDTLDEEWTTTAATRPMIHRGLAVEELPQGRLLDLVLCDPALKDQWRLLSMLLHIKRVRLDALDPLLKASILDLLETCEHPSEATIEMHRRIVEGVTVMYRSRRATAASYATAPSSRFADVDDDL